MKAVNLGTKEIGPGNPCFIIAEAGVNHNGNLQTALRLIDAAVDAHADAVKFQTFIAEKVVSPYAPKAEYQLQTTSAEESQLDMVRPLQLSPEDHRQMASYCAEKGIMFLSTPFDQDSADLLEELGVPLFKIPSGEITNLDLIRHVAKKGKPVILSTGMSYLGEVETALQAIEQAGNDDIVLLHCVSNYPADIADVNLRAMKTMSDAFQRPVGYSDHTPGIEVALAAAALSACVIEKHFTLDCRMPGPDHKASLEPRDLAAMVRGIRNIEKALGTGRKQPAPSEAGTSAVARRSLVATRDIPEGTRLTADMISVLRPGTGLAPCLKPVVISRLARIDIPAGTVVTWEMLA